VVAENLSCIPLRKRTRGSGEKTYVGRKMSNPTSQAIVAKHHSRRPLGVDMNKW